MLGNREIVLTGHYSNSLLITVMIIIIIKVILIQYISGGLWRGADVSFA